MPEIRIAFDRSARHVDADGRLHVERSHISKATVNPYYGSEIPGADGLGLDPTKIYYLLRDPVELERGAPTFARLPILSKHTPVSAEDPQKDLVVGAIGSNVEFAAPYLDADLCFWDETAIAGIDSDTIRELSCSYHYAPVMEPGEYDGKRYDGRMTKIEGNHLAIVEVGRAGSDVLVADANPFQGLPEMKQTKLGKALVTAFRVASQKLAADAALQPLLGSADRKTFKKADVAGKLRAMDEELDPEVIDKVIDALLDVEEPDAVEPPPDMGAGDESPADKLRKLLAGKVDEKVIEEACALMEPADAAEDEEQPAPPKEDTKAAMDAALGKLRADLKAAAEAARDVRATVGDVIGMDSASDIHGFALDQMKVDRAGVTGAPALRALYRLAATRPASPAPTVAQDVAGLASRFPGAARFGRA